MATLIGSFLHFHAHCFFNLLHSLTQKKELIFARVTETQELDQGKCLSSPRTLSQHCSDISLQFIKKSQVSRRFFSHNFRRLGNSLKILLKSHF